LRGVFNLKALEPRGAQLSYRGALVLTWTRAMLSQCTMRRAWKLELIEKMNPEWTDLFEQIV
jgi:hypothetical protein